MSTLLSRIALLCATFFALPVLGIKPLGELQRDARALSEIRQSILADRNDIFYFVENTRNLEDEEESILPLLSKLSETFARVSNITQTPVTQQEVENIVNTMPELYVLEDITPEIYLDKLAAFFNQIERILNTTEKQIHAQIAQQTPPAIPKPAPTVQPAKPTPSTQQPVPTAAPSIDYKATVAQVRRDFQELKPQLQETQQAVWIPQLGTPWPFNKKLWNTFTDKILNTLTAVAQTQTDKEKITTLREQGLILLSRPPYPMDVYSRKPGDLEVFFNKLDAFIDSLEQKNP